MAPTAPASCVRLEVVGGTCIHQDFSSALICLQEDCVDSCEKFTKVTGRGKGKGKVGLNGDLHGADDLRKLQKEGGGKMT